MRGWTPNDDGVYDYYEYADLVRDEESETAHGCHSGMHGDPGEPDVEAAYYAAVNGELTQPLTPDEERAWADECYDAACPCMDDIHRGRVRRYKSLPESDLWRDEGGGG